MTGNKFIDCVVEEMKKRGKVCDDSSIVRFINMLSKYDLDDILLFEKIVKHENVNETDFSVSLVVL